MNGVAKMGGCRPERVKFAEKGGGGGPKKGKRKNTKWAVGARPKRAVGEVRIQGEKVPGVGREVTPQKTKNVKWTLRMNPTSQNWMERARTSWEGNTEIMEYIRNDTSFGSKKGQKTKRRTGSER